MKLFLDQDVYHLTLLYLRESGFDVVTASEMGSSRSEDEDLLTIAHEQGRILVTRDKDFGSLVYLKHVGTGVIFLRMLPSTIQAVHEELGRVLDTYTHEQMQQSFTVIEPGRHRIRKLPVL